MKAVYKTKGFAKWARKEKLNSQSITDAINEIVEGNLMADLGSGLYKKRIARQGGGKRGGFRTLLALKDKHRLIFMFGFSKNERENISAVEKEALKRLAASYLGATERQIAKLCQAGDLIEVKYEQQK